MLLFSSFLSHSHRANLSSAGTAAPLRAAARAAAGRVDGDLPLRLSGRAGDGPRQVHNAEGCQRRRGRETGGLGAAAKLAAQAHRPRAL